MEHMLFNDLAHIGHKPVCGLLGRWTEEGRGQTRFGISTEMTKGVKAQVSGTKVLNKLKRQEIEMMPNSQSPPVAMDGKAKGEMDFNMSQYAVQLCHCSWGKKVFYMIGKWRLAKPLP